MKKYALLKKPLAVLLAVAIVFSAFGTLSLFTFAASSVDDLSATFDFETADQVDSWVQVGAKSGAETEEGYTSWNYDPTVGEAYGLEKKTIDVRQINFATGANIEKTSSNALLVGPYLNKNQADYTVLNKAPAAGAYENQAGLTSIVALAQTVDNGVAKDGLVKKSVSGRFALSDEESNAGPSVPYQQVTKDAGYSSPILVYYYKDANNWRGVRVTASYWNTFNVFDMLRYQVIICEDGYSYRTTLGAGNQAHTAGFFSTLAPDYVNQFTLGVEYASQKEAIATSTASVEGLFPVLPGIRNANIKNNFKAGEWLNFNFDYEPSGVQFTISDATGYKRTVLIANETTCKMYDESGASKAISKIDVSKGTFGVGATYSIGTNSYKSTEQTKFAFDDIKVNMYSTNSADNSGINAVSKLIASITDEQSFETAKQAFEALTAEQKAKVSNRLEYYKFQQRFNEKRITFDFSEDWQKDIIAAQQGVGDGNVVNTAQYAYWKEIFQDKSGQNLLKLCNGYNENNRVQSFFVNLTDEELADVESVTLSVKGGFKAKNDDIATAWSNSTDNACPRLVLLNATTGVPGNTNADRLRIYRVAATGAINQSSSWSVYAAYPVTVDLMQDFDIILRPNASNPNKTDLIYQGYRTELNADTGMYEATNVYGPTVNAKGAETFLTIDRKINKISFAYSAKLEWNLSSVDVKYDGWENVVHLTADEEAMIERISNIGEITLTNAEDKETIVSAIRADFDALNSTALQTYIPDGEELTYAEKLALKEEEIAVYLGKIKVAQDFVDAYSTAINYTAPSITTREIAAEVKVAYDAYNLLADETKSILNNNYGLVGYSFAIGTTLTDVLYPVALDVIPTAEQLAFENHYATKAIAEMTTATINLSDVDTAITLYNAIGDRQDRYTTEYAHICEMLEGLFIVDDGKQVIYTESDYADYANIYNYFKDTIFTAASNGRTNNNKIIDPDKFDGTKANNIVLAYDYGQITKNKQGTWSGYQTYNLLNMFPSVGKISTLANNAADNYLFTLEQRANKPTVYVGGVNVASNTDKKNVIIPYYDNSYDANGKGQYYGINRAMSSLGTGEVDGSYTYSTSKYISAMDAHPDATNDLINYYQAPYDRLCVKMEYETTYIPQYNAVDGNTYQRTGVKYSELMFWYEDSSLDGTPGNTPFVYDGEKNAKGKWVNNDGSCDILVGWSSGSSEVGITYAEQELLLPQLYLGDTAISHLQYMSISRDETFAEENEALLEKATNNEITNDDTTDIVDLYKQMSSLTEYDKLFVDDATMTAYKNAIKFITPKSNGSTLSIGAETKIGFAVNRPTSNDYYKFGIVVGSYNNMVDKGYTSLTKGQTGTVYTEKTYTDINAEKGDELLFTVSTLFDSEETAGSTWGKWLVARFYTVYKDSGGKDVIVYNNNLFVDGDGKNNNPAKATAIDSTNVLIRSVNGILAGAAAKLYGYKDDADVVDVNGLSYVDIDGASQSTYTSTTFATAMASTKSGKLSTAVDTLYLIKAFRNILSIEAKKLADAS